VDEDEDGEEWEEEELTAGAADPQPAEGSRITVSGKDARNDSCCCCCCSSGGRSGLVSKEVMTDEEEEEAAEDAHISFYSNYASVY